MAIVGTLALAALGVGPIDAASDSARYRWEANKWLALDLSVADVRVEMIRFEWPSTILGIKTGYKATVKVVNGSARQIGIGIALALYDREARLVGVGTAGTTLGTIDPGDTAEFTVDFDHAKQRLEAASQFHILLEIS